MRSNIISCLLIFLFVHELVMVNKYSSLCVEARSLQYYYYKQLFSELKVARELRSSNRNKGRGNPTMSPPKPNWNIHFKFPPPRPPPPPSNYP